MRGEPVRRSGRKFRGFRAWTLEGYRLRSANPAGGHWIAGVNRAGCRRGAYAPVPPLQAIWASASGMQVGNDRSPHRAPDPKCGCGLYAWYEPDRLSRFAPGAGELVYGVVLAWGRIEVHVDGLRAEYAEPALLAFGEGQSYRHVRRVQAIGSELGLPVVELADLEQAAGAFGQPVPAELRPTPVSAFQIDSRWAVPLAAGGLLVATALLEGLKQAQRSTGMASGAAGFGDGDGDGAAGPPA